MRAIVFHRRAASYLSRMPRDCALGHMVSDISAILGSLDFVMGECDR